jgi:hypothetical protein
MKVRSLQFSRGISSSSKAKRIAESQVERRLTVSLATLLIFHAVLFLHPFSYREANLFRYSGSPFSKKTASSLILSTRKS